MRIAYQGAPGAFSEAATLALFPRVAAEPRETFADVFTALEREEVDGAVVPVENSFAGAVVDVYDLLRRHRSVRIVAEAMLRVRHHLLGVRGASLAGVGAARSHPQALAQVEPFLRLHGIRPVTAYDTAGAAAEVAAAGDATVAAVASRAAAERYGLEILAADIEGSPDNMTRFFALARERDTEIAQSIAPELRGGAAKTSLAYATQNVPGALVRSLQPFATAGLQLTKIESRPSREAPWDYVFYLDFEGDPAVSPATEALALMRTCCSWVHILGTYPAATSVIG